MTVHSALYVALGMTVAAGCADHPSPAALASGLDAAQPYVSQFGSFERWVQRAWSVRDTHRTDRAFVEALFAPIRNDAGVQAALVVSDAAPAVEIAFPTSAVVRPAAGTRVRHPTLGWIVVSVESPCSVRHGRQPALTKCTLIERAPTRDSHTSPRLTMAFVVEAVPQSAVRTR